MPRNESRWTTPWNLVATVLTSTATTAKAIDSTNTICWAWFFGSWGGSGLVEFGWYSRTFHSVWWNCCSCLLKLFVLMNQPVISNLGGLQVTKIQDVKIIDFSKTNKFARRNYLYPGCWGVGFWAKEWRNRRRQRVKHEWQPPVYSKSTNISIKMGAPNTHSNEDGWLTFRVEKPRFAMRKFTLGPIEIGLS